MSGDAQQHGVRYNLEVVLGDRCGLRVSNEAWPFKYPYEFIDWIKLDQLGADVFVDIIGSVIVEPSFDSNNCSPKLHVQLGNGDFRQDVECLGEVMFWLWQVCVSEGRSGIGVYEVIY
jgi:hypothetical protein